MKKLLALSALAFAVPAQSAILVSFQNGASVLPAGTSIFENFEDETNLQSIGTNANVYSGSVNNVAARPAFGSTGNFGAVLADGNYTVMFSTAASIFSFALGSLDSYNRLTLIMSSGGPVEFNGNEINNGPFEDGNQVGGATNGRVSFTADGPFILGATFESDGANSFEFDDLAIQAVPEPSTWLMMLVGFAAVGFGMRRRNAQGTPAIA